MAETNLVWTKKPPEEDGHYWWRLSLGHHAGVVLVRNGVVLRHMLMQDTYNVPENIGGEWHGPLQPPGGDAIENCEKALEG